MTDNTKQFMKANQKFLKEKEKLDESYKKKLKKLQEKAKAESWR